MNIQQILDLIKKNYVLCLVVPLILAGCTYVYVNADSGADYVVTKTKILCQPIFSGDSAAATAEQKMFENEVSTVAQYVSDYISDYEADDIKVSTSSSSDFIYLEVAAPNKQRAEEVEAEISDNVKNFVSHLSNIKLVNLGDSKVEQSQGDSKPLQSAVLVTVLGFTLITASLVIVKSNKNTEE